MRVTRKIAAAKLAAYVHGTLPLPALVDWAENAVAEGSFESAHQDLLMKIVGRLGVADTDGFNLNRDDCTRMLRQLGGKARIDAVMATPGGSRP